MITSQEIVLILGKRESWKGCNRCWIWKLKEQTYRQDSPIENHRGPLNLMNGRDDTTTFLPLDSRIGGQNRNSPTVGQY